MSDRKPRMPSELVPMADAALVRHRKRRFVPDVIETESGWDCPYSEADADRWWALLFDVFGTRHAGTVTMFFDQLGAMLDTRWDEEWNRLVFDGDRMVALLTLVQAMKPQNEAQAAYAAQLVALHLNAMKLAEGAMRYSGGDGRSVAILAKAARAYGDGLVTMRKLQGKGGSSKQSIKVEKRVYYQQTNNYGGGDETGGQPHGPRAAAIEASAALPSSCQVGNVVPLPCGEGQAGLPSARSAGWRSKG